MLFINVLVAGLAAIAAAIPLPSHGNGTGLVAYQASLQHAGGDTTPTHGGIGAFVEKTVAKIGENLPEPLRVEGAGKTLQPRLIIIHPGEPLHPVIIICIVLACIVVVGSLVGIGFFCCSERRDQSREQERKTAEVNDAARVKLAALLAGAGPNEPVKQEAAGTDARDSVVEPTACYLQPRK